MKISKYIMIDENIKLPKIHLSKIKHNKCKADLYLLCTPPNHGELFEIIEGKYLTSQYEECYLIGLAKDKETAIQYLGELVDQMYNMHTLDYQNLKA